MQKRLETMRSNFEFGWLGRIGKAQVLKIAVVGCRAAAENEMKRCLRRS